VSQKQPALLDQSFNIFLSFSNPVRPKGLFLQCFSGVVDALI